VACCRLYQLIDPREEVVVLRASLVDIGKVDAYSSLAIFFFTKTRLESQSG